MSTLTVQNIQGSASSSNTISVASGHVLNAPGHVIQTVYATQASQESTTSTSFVNTSLAATITPTSASNKILVLANVNMYGDTNDVHSVCTVYRGTISGTNIGNGDWGIGGSYAGASPVKNSWLWIVSDLEKIVNSIFKKGEKTLLLTIIDQNNRRRYLGVKIN